MQTYATLSQERLNGNVSTAAKNKSFFSPAIVQPKLTINQPNDPYEQEADYMADKVMRMEQPGIQLKRLDISAIQRKCDHCEEEEKNMQRKEMDRGETTADGALENYVGNLNSSGQSLPNEVRSFYEPRFGYDFSNVKVHTGSVAAKSAQSINALAYTSGNNIVFNSGQYSADTDSGKRLLAHELTHVVQQGTIQGASDSVMRQKKPENEFESCSGSQKSQLLPILEDAKKAVNFARAVVGTAFGRPDKMSPQRRQHFLDHFHTTSRDDLRDILSTYTSLGESITKGLKIKCEAVCDKDANQVTCGYAYNTQWFGGWGPIHICFDKAGCNFASTNTSKNERIALIIHEAAHRHTGVDDKAYKWNAKYKTLSSGDAIDNADSYAWFATLL